MKDLQSALEDGVSGVEVIENAALIARLAGANRTLRIVHEFLAGLTSTGNGLTAGLEIMGSHHEANDASEEDETASIKTYITQLGEAKDAIDHHRFDLERLSFAQLKPSVTVSGASWKANPHEAFVHLRTVAQEYEYWLSSLRETRNRLVEVVEVAHSTIRALNVLQQGFFDASQIDPLGPLGTMLGAEGLRLDGLKHNLALMRRVGKAKLKSLDSILSSEQAKYDNIKGNLDWLEKAAESAQQAVRKANLIGVLGIEFTVRYSSDGGKTWGSPTSHSTTGGTVRQVRVAGQELIELGFAEEVEDVSDNSFYLKLRVATGQEESRVDLQTSKERPAHGSSVDFFLGLSTAYKATDSMGSIDAWVARPRSDDIVQGTLSCTAVLSGSALVNGDPQDLIRIEAIRFGAQARE